MLCLINRQGYLFQNVTYLLCLCYTIVNLYFAIKCNIMCSILLCIVYVIYMDRNVLAITVFKHCN